MRILHVDTGRTMQGGQWQALYLLRGLRDRGYEVPLVARGELAGRAAAEGFTVNPPNPYRDCDLVHAHDARAHTAAVLRANVPVVVSRRVAFPVQTGWLSRWKYSRAAHYIAISGYVRRILLSAGIKPETISVVYDGVPVGEYREPAAGGPVIGILKDPLRDVLLEAALSAGVEVVDASGLAAELKRASALAYVTAMQGLGSAAIAALAAGVPVIASRAGGLTEVVEHERTGLLVDNDVASVAAALRRVTRDRDLALALSREGWESARRRFSDMSMVQGTVEVYERLLG